MIMKIGIRWFDVFFFLAALLSFGELHAEKPEGELNPDLTNPGSVAFPQWFKVSFLDIREDVNEAAQEKKNVLLFFYQDGCPYCKRTIEVNFAQKDITEKTQQQFDVIAINMWGDREVGWLDGSQLTEKKLAEKLKVMFTPTLIFIDQTGKVALRVNGYYHPRKFDAALDYVANKEYEKTPFREYLAKVQPVPAHGKLHTQPFIDKPPYDFSKKSGKPLLVLFEQNECPACDELHGDVLKRKETLDQIRPFKVAQLDMWSKQAVITPEGKTLAATDWAKALDIKFAPSLVFFDEGKEVIRTEAFLKSFHIQSVMEYVSSKAYKKFPSFQRYIEDRAEKLRKQGIQINIMQ